MTISPRHGDFGFKDKAFERFEFSRTFENPNPGQNFSFGLGLGVALIVEKVTDGVLEIPMTPRPNFACLRVDDFQLEFIGKARKDDVKV
jgi:hypothetical protein